MPGIAAADQADYQQYMHKLKAGIITPLGSKRAGNEAGTIPAWNCNNGVPADINVPASIRDTHHFPAFKNFPFVDEKPRFVITIDNYKKYKEHMTAGTIKRLKKYPNEFRIPVYQTHRTACYPQYVYDAVAKNALHAKLVDSGTGLVGAKLAKAFPVVDSALEAVKNNSVPAKNWYEKAVFTGIAKFPDHKEVQRTFTVNNNFYNDPTISREEYYSWDAQIFSVYIHKVLYPPRKRGTTTLGWGYLRPLTNLRVTWQYLPGTRRVRRYPYYGFDTPQGAGALRGIAEQRIFNGSPEKFNWKILGIRQVYVPINTYGLYIPDSYQELLGTHVINPKYMRWELRRVRVIKATLKPNERLWYSKRVFYQLLDSGRFVMSDNYDHQGVLWRTEFQTFFWSPATNDLLAGVAAYFDFKVNAYTVQRMINETPKPRRPVYNTKHPRPDDYGPARLRQIGKR